MTSTATTNEISSSAQNKISDRARQLKEYKEKVRELRKAFHAQLNKSVSADAIKEEEAVEARKETRKHREKEKLEIRKKNYEAHVERIAKIKAEKAERKLVHQETWRRREEVFKARRLALLKDIIQDSEKWITRETLSTHIDNYVNAACGGSGLFASREDPG